MSFYELTDMEKIYSRDNYNVSYKRFSKTRRRPGRPPSCNNEPPVNCFVCDEKITRQKVNLVLGTSSNKSGFPSQISQLLGDEFLIIVQEDDYLCKHCVSLFNNMDKLERQLSIVKDTLLCYLKKKYNLTNDYDGKINNAGKEGQEKFVETRVKDDSLKNDDDDDDDDITKELNDLHSGKNDEQALLKCNICEFSTNDKNDYDRHVRSHITFAMESEYSESSSSCFGDFLKNSSPSLSVKLFKCSICFKMYVTRYKCIEHMKNSHVIDKSVVENNNDELFNNLKRKSNSKLLKKLHSQQNAYYCNNCFKSFINESEFNKHNSNNCTLEDYENVNNINNSSSNSNFSDINFKNILKNNFDNVSSECNSKDSPRKFDLFLSNDSKQNISVDSCNKIIKENNSEMFRQNNMDDSLEKGMKETDSTKNVLEEEEEDDDDDIGAGDVDYASHDEDNENGEDTDEIEEDDDGSDYEPMKHVCGNCGFRGDLVSLREHFFEIRPQRDLVCSICGQSFNSYCKLIKHSNGHDINSEPYDCIYCDNIKVPDLLSLNYHMKKTHLNLIDEKVCNLCNQNFPNLDYLNKHLNNKCCLNCIDVNKDCENNKICCDDDDDDNNYNEKFNGGNAERVEISRGLVEVKSEQKVASYDVDENPDQLNFSGKINKNSEELFIFSHKVNENMDEIKSKNLFQSCRSDFNNDKGMNDIRNKTNSDEKVESSDSVNELPVDETLNVVYKCGICGVHRNSKDELLTHFENHTSSYYNNDNNYVSSLIDNENKYICHICNVNFNDNLMLKQHAVKHSNIPQNTCCLYCNENFHDELNLKYHIIHMHSYDIAVMYCNLCKSKSNNVLSYKHHLIYKHKLMKNDENNNYYCKKCNRNFNFKWKLLKHYCKYHKNEFKCRFCNVVVKNFKELIKHDKLHFRNGNNMYKCDVCYRLVKSKLSLNFHKLRHTCELNLYCRICELSFIDISTLNEHINIKHNNMDDLYSCNKCGKNFKKYNSYKIHRLSHENEHLLYECKLCHVRFSNMSLRAIHKRKLHKNQYSLNCNICCSFNTNRLDIYRRHFNLHCKKSHYNCKKCLKIFTNRRRFNEHKLKIHNNKERLDYINYKKIKVKPDDISELNYNINGVDILLNNPDNLKNSEGKTEQCCQFLQSTNFMR